MNSIDSFSTEKEAFAREWLCEVFSAHFHDMAVLVFLRHEAGYLSPFTLFSIFFQYLLTRRVHTANVHLLLILALNLYAHMHMWILSVYELFVSTTYSHSSRVEILNSKDPSISFPSKMEMSYFNGFLIENWADAFE